MDKFRFDEITRRPAEDTSRRRLVAGLLGGTALLTGVGIAEAKKGKGKAKGKGKGKNNGNGGGNGGGNGKGKKHGHNKVAICHKVDEDTFEFKRVPQPALKKGHRKHGDTICGEAGTCQTGEATDCNDDGTCVFANAPDGEPCTNELGAAGTCLAGVCVI